MSAPLKGGNARAPSSGFDQQFRLSRIYILNEASHELFIFARYTLINYFLGRFDLVLSVLGDFYIVNSHPLSVGHPV